MDFFNLFLVFHWFDESLQLLQRLFVVVIAAFITIRFDWWRQAIRGAELKWRYRILATLTFGFLAVIGTHTGIPIDIHKGWWTVDFSAEVPQKLDDSQAVVGFRDTMTLAAGMIGGPWVGFGVGLIAGVDRYHLGGLAAFASSFGTLLLGIYAGGIRYLRPQWVSSVKGVFWVAITGTLIHRLMILFFVKPYADALALSWEVLVPVAVVNTFGCVLFFWILRDLDRDRLENEAHESRLLVLQSEVRALRAQVDAHFLNNTLNDIKALIREKPDSARDAIQQLADFFKYTRKFVEQNTISLAEEQEQLQRYLNLQRLGLDLKLQDVLKIPDELLAIQVLPGCLLTLVENALKHGFKGKPAPYLLTVTAARDQTFLVLRVKDNGHGITSERLPKLGQQEVESANNGSGVALHQLSQSLQLIFGKSAELCFASERGKGTTVLLKQPIRE